MQKASFNQLSNVKNPYQGRTRKVLCVCSAGLLRSPTLANVIHQDYGYNTRACGSSEEYALIPITQALVEWADTIVFVEEPVYNYCISVQGLSMDYLDACNKDVIVLDLPDEFPWNSEDLKDECRKQLSEVLPDAPKT